jgi:Flp pilus assembly protein TadG
MKRLRRLDSSGASAAEFALVLPLLMLFIFGIIDAGRFLWEFNRAEKATQMGVRYAAVTDMVPATLATQNFALLNGIPGGDPVPTSEFDTTSCDTTTCTNGWCYSATAFDNIVTRMNYMYPAITDSNVTVEYKNVGLGYAGDPTGPDVAPLVTVRLRNMTFQPVVGLIFGLSINMPDFAAGMTLEDGTGTVSN